MLALALAHVWLTIGPPIQHPSDGVPLRWNGPIECPDEASLRERVHALAPGLLEQRDAASSRVEVEIVAAEDGHSATVVVRSSDGETRRTFSASDCEIATDALATVASDMMLMDFGIEEGMLTVYDALVGYAVTHECYDDGDFHELQLGIVARTVSDS